LFTVHLLNSFLYDRPYVYANINTADFYLWHDYRVSFPTIRVWVEFPPHSSAYGEIVETVGSIYPKIR